MSTMAPIFFFIFFMAPISHSVFADINRLYSPCLTCFTPINVVDTYVGPEYHKKARFRLSNISKTDLMIGRHLSDEIRF